MCRVLPKVQDKLISRKLVLRDVTITQLQARYLCKANESQLARESQTNFKIQENAITIIKTKK